MLLRCLVSAVTEIARWWRSLRQSRAAARIVQSARRLARTTGAWTPARPAGWAVMPIPCVAQASTGPLWNGDTLELDICARLARPIIPAVSAPPASVASVSAPAAPAPAVASVSAPVVSAPVVSVASVSVAPAGPVHFAPVLVGPVGPVSVGPERADPVVDREREPERSVPTPATVAVGLTR